MEQENVEKSFNVGTPTNDNIEFAFKNLLFYLTGVTELEIYQTYWNDSNKILIKVKNVLNSYINNKTLIFLKEETLNSIKLDLIELDSNTKMLNSYYAEWALLWFEALISLRKSELNMKGVI